MNNKSKTFVAILLFSVTGFVAMAIPLYIYVRHFQGRFFSPDPAAWALFGDYVIGVLNPILGILNLCVIVYLATVVHSIQKGEGNEAKALQTACEMHKEWSSEQMYRSRKAAYKFLQAHPKADLRTLEESQRREPQLQHVWVVIGFFERLQTMLYFSIVRAEHIAAIFGEIFVWWDTFCFYDQLPAGWMSHERIASLRKEIHQRIGDTKLKDWTDYANTYKEPPTRSPKPENEM